MKRHTHPRWCTGVGTIVWAMTVPHIVRGDLSLAFLETSLIIHQNKQRGVCMFSSEGIWSLRELWIVSVHYYGTFVVTRRQACSLGRLLRGSAIFNVCPQAARHHLRKVLGVALKITWTGRGWLRGVEWTIVTAFQGEERNNVPMYQALPCVTGLNLFNTHSYPRGQVLFLLDSRLILKNFYIPTYIHK